MSLLRKLSLVYVLCALAFSVELAFDRDPALEQASRNTVASGLDAVRAYITQPVGRLARAGIARIVAAVSFPQPAATPANQSAETPADIAPPPVVIPAPAPLSAPPPAFGAPVIPDAAVPLLDVADAQPVPEAVTITPAHRVPHLAGALPAPKKVAITPAHWPPRMAAVPLPLRPSIATAPSEPAPAAPSAARASLPPAELVRVTVRLKENLTREMLDNFGLFLYVSKADTGPWAQRLYVFRKDAGGNLAMLYNWPASTGRERDEIAANGTRQPSVTPQGYYQLDPDRMYRNHFSGQWHEQMPFSMFFNWENKGVRTGLAIHGATGAELAQLGARASAGCIRIAPQNAALLFKLIREQYKGLAPRFAYNQRTATMSNEGVMLHDASGNLQMAAGYRVLVFIENYGGGNVVAALF